MSSCPEPGKEVQLVEQSLEQQETDYSGLGLLANPFTPPSDGSTHPIGVRLAVQAAALRLLCALEASATSEDRKPIVVEKSPEIPAYYNIAATARLFTAIAQGDPVPGILQAYVPIDMMRIGRVRAPLGIVAERVAGPGVDLTIAAWSRVALADPDRSLSEFSALESVDLDEILVQIDADPAAFTARVFGDGESRHVDVEDAEMMMRIATSRTTRLDPDPAEGDDAPADAAALTEEVLDDPMADAFVTRLDTVEEDSLAAGGVDAPEPEDTVEQGLAEYIIAYTSEHLSPVIARGIRAFAAQGVDAMAQEFKVSKAPSKTLAALFRFAETRMRLGVVMFDNFAIWPSIPADLRLKIVSTFSQLRWTLNDVGVLVLFVTPGSAPEVEESFASGRHVSWDFSELFRVSDAGAMFDAEAVSTWLASAALDAQSPAWGEALIAAVPEGTSLESACEVLSTEIDRAAKTGTLPEASLVASVLEDANA